MQVIVIFCDDVRSSLALSFHTKRDHTHEVFDGIKHVQLNPEIIVKAQNASNDTMKTDPG